MESHKTQKRRKNLWEKLLDTDEQSDVLKLPDKLRQMQWSPIRTLGEGAFGEVRLLGNKSPNPDLVFAVKCVDTSATKDAKELFRKLRREAISMRVVSDSQHIIRYLGMRYVDGFIEMFLEYADGGELFDLIEPDRGMPTWKGQRYFRQMITGVKHIHSKGIAHRDIKPENLLLTKNDDLKICDFGLATIFRHRGVERKLATKCGTKEYISPQVVAGCYRGEAADIWSCGVVLAVMLSGALPWEEPTRNDRGYKYWVDGMEWRRMPPWEKLDGPTLNLVRKMLDRDEEKRITIPDIEEHEFFVDDAVGAPNRRPPKSSVILTSGNVAPVSKSLDSKLEGSAIAEPSESSLEQEAVPQHSDVEQAQAPEKKPRLLTLSDTAAAPNESESKSSKANQPSDLGNYYCSLRSEYNHELGSEVTVSTISQPNPSSGISQAIRDSRLDALTSNYFSQPVGVELLSQIDYNTTQHPLTLLAHRMTRFCVKTRTDETITLIKERLDIKFTCVLRAPNIMSVSGPRNLMSYVITIYEMIGEDGTKVMVDCRRSRGDGIEFKRAFLDLRRKLHDIICEAGNNWLEKHGLTSTHH